MVNKIDLRFYVHNQFGARIAFGSLSVDIQRIQTSEYPLAIIRPPFLTHTVYIKLPMPFNGPYMHRHTSSPTVCFERTVKFFFKLLLVSSLKLVKCLTNKKTVLFKDHLPSKVLPIELQHNSVHYETAHHILFLYLFL